MGNLFFFIEDISIGLYIFIAILFLWNIRSLVLSQSDLREAQFGLERELAQRRGGRSVTMLLLSMELVVLVWAISGVSAPAWRDGLPPEFRGENDGIPFATSVPIAGEGFIVESRATDDFGVFSTAPPPSTPSGTIVAPGGREGCIYDTAWISIPDDGMRVFEPITIKGVADIDNFSFYRFEIRKSGGGGNFAPLPQDHVQPIPLDEQNKAGDLGQLIPDLYLDGEYRFRLVVFDTNSNPIASCEITIYISPPVPTETPIGASSS